jgi:predicted SAM-dependent methyltransferase
MMGLALRDVKKPVVRMLGRERANRLSAPYHDRRARRRTRATLERLPAHGLLVNLGCGHRPLPGWVNLDIARGPGVDVVWDLREGLPFRSGSCAAILGEHVIEHLDRPAAERLARECLRALEPGGVVRLSTPDLGRFLRSYAGDGAFIRHPEFPREAETPMDRVNMAMREGGQHLWSYDAASLTLLLEKAGFVTVVEREAGASAHALLQGVDSPDRAFESLYVEAQAAG